eukprot:11499836-Alexandrium_andersonii.AAC.1
MCCVRRPRDSDPDRLVQEHARVGGKDGQEVEVRARSAALAEAAGGADIEVGVMHEAAGGVEGALLQEVQEAEGIADE